MSFIDMRQVDFRAAISESLDLKLLGCLALQPNEVIPSPGVGTKQLDEGQAFLKVSLTLLSAKLIRGAGDIRQAIR